MKIEKVDNGYIVEYDGVLSTRKIFTTLDDLFREMLLQYEGRCSSFGGDLYGDVKINRRPRSLPDPKDTK